MSSFDRVTKKKTDGKGRLAGALATGIAALGAGWLATRDGGAPEQPHPDTAAQQHEPTAATPNRLSENDAANPLDNEDPGLEGDDLARAKENAAFKQRMADALSDALPHGYSVAWTTSTEGKPEYNEFLQIFNANGKHIGDVYPDEGDQSLRFLAKDEVARLYSDTLGSPLVPFDSTDPVEIAQAVQDAEQLSGFQDQWTALNEKWPSDKRFTTNDDGTMTINPEYTADEYALKSQMADAASNSKTITTASENAQREENAAEAADTGE